MVCPNCKGEIADDARFCNTCGRTLIAQTADSNASAPPAAAMGAQQAPLMSSAVQSAGVPDNVAGALCYLFGWVSGLVFLLVAPYNARKSVRFHAWQSILLSISIAVLYVALGIAIFVLTLITRGLLVILYPLLLALPALVLVVVIMLIVKAYNNDRLVLPIIGEMAERLA